MYRLIFAGSALKHKVHSTGIILATKPDLSLLLGALHEVELCLKAITFACKRDKTASGVQEGSEISLHICERE